MAGQSPAPGQPTALVTGVSEDGIGGALATELQRQGYFVFCTARRSEAMETFQKPGFGTVLVDVMSTKSILSAVETVSQLTDGKLDVLINNAGIATHIPALDLDVDGVVHDMFNVNVLGVMRMVKAFATLLIRAQGTIINIGSVAPIIPLAFSSSYNATKAALHAYGDCLSMEMKPFDVKVVTIITGSVKSGIVRNVQPELPEGSLYNAVREFWLKRVNVSQANPMPTEQYAQSVVKMIKSKRQVTWFWQGSASIFAWFLYYFLPRSLRLRMVARRFGLLGWKAPKP